MWLLCLVGFPPKNGQPSATVPSALSPIGPSLHPPNWPLLVDSIIEALSPRPSPSTVPVYEDNVGMFSHA